MPPLMPRRFLSADAMLFAAFFFMLVQSRAAALSRGLRASMPP